MERVSGNDVVISSHQPRHQDAPREVAISLPLIVKYSGATYSWLVHDLLACKL